MKGLEICTNISLEMQKANFSSLSFLQMASNFSDRVCYVTEGVRRAGS